MLYTVANDTWAPGSPLSASETRTGLYRTRGQADEIAAGRRLLAVSVRYDATRCVVTSTPPADRVPGGGWSAPAIVGPTGGVTALATIPAALVRPLGPFRLRVHAGHTGPACPHLPGRDDADRRARRR
jgi:hypothetical protein